MPASDRQCLRLFDAAEIDAVVRRMAAEALALLPEGRGVLVGMLRRGEPLARLLQRHMVQLSGQRELPLYGLKVKRYADDLSLLHPDTALSENPELAALDLAASSLLVVDDVLYQGHSLLRTCGYLARLGAREVRCAVLVDRHLYRQPIRADIVGIHLQVAEGDVVECHVPPYEPELCLEVVRHGVS